MPKSQDLMIRDELDRLPDGNSGTIMVSRSGRTVASKSVGIVDAESNATNLDDTQYLIGSVTKQFTAVAMLRALYDKALKSGIPETETEQLDAYVKAELQKPISNFMPKEHSIWAGQMPVWADTVTLHHLLCHSSGIPNFTGLSGFQELRELVEPTTAPELVSFFKNREQYKDSGGLEFQAGTKPEYSNSGYFMLGEVIKQITGKQLDVYMDEVLFKPAEMTTSFFATQGKVHEIINDPRAPTLARAYGYDVSSPEPLPIEVNYEHMQIPAAAGAIVSTAPDLLKWNNALYSGSIMPKFLVDLMLYPHMSGTKPEESTGYGIMVKKSPSLGVYYTHGGSIPGFLSKLTYIPSQQLSIVSLTNAAQDWKTSTALKEASDKLKKQLNSRLPPLSGFEKNKRYNKAMEAQFPNILKNKPRFAIMDKEADIITGLEHLAEEQKHTTSVVAQTGSASSDLQSRLDVVSFNLAATQQDVSPSSGNAGHGVLLQQHSQRPTQVHGPTTSNAAISATEGPTVPASATTRKKGKYTKS